MGRMKDEDVSWVQRELPGLPTALYTVDDPSAPLTVPRNKGREAMVYLTYIIDHYDNLSDTTLFFHSHRSAWHNNVLLDLSTPLTIRRLSDDRVARTGYFNARCHLDPGCPDWIHIDRPEIDRDPVRKVEEEHFTRELWMELHPGARVPPVLSQPCCAQFAVSRARLRTLPRAEYERYRDWLLRTPLEDGLAGRVMEYNWQYIFARRAELCPRMDSCYCDGYGICFGGAAKLKAWLDKLRQWEIAGEKARAWRDAAGDPQRQAGLEKDQGHWEQREASLKRELDEEKRQAYERGDNLDNRIIEASRYP